MMSLIMCSTSVLLYVSFIPHFYLSGNGKILTHVLPVTLLFYITLPFFAGLFMHDFVYMKVDLSLFSKKQTISLILQKLTVCLFINQTLLIGIMSTNR